MFQQAAQQVLEPIFERDVQSNSFRFRLKRSAHQALTEYLVYINEGNQHIVDIDLKSFFDEVDHDILLSFIYKKVRCVYMMKLILQFLRASIQTKLKSLMTGYAIVCITAYGIIGRSQSVRGITSYS
ncbi:MAG: retron-type reverse transcriptase [Patiriisocius sp.]